MNNDITKELNNFLKGNLMAIDAYDNYIHHIQDHELKQIFQQIQQNHKHHAMLIAERIQNLDGMPANEVGIMGNVAQLMSRKTIETDHILQDALTGEQRGIEKSKQILNGDLDDESLTLVETILASNEKHVALLNKFIM
ncbi:MAG TPA: ferritin-like domain-containing protein [Candidatus Dormibacteraeota bacterium]|nr:ferritin-like domain-containing protein [Candidatus Dormibacteraeota bacterium]